MDHHGVGLLFEVPDARFGDAVLPVGIHPTVGDALVLLGKGLKPGIVDKSTVVGVIVANSYPVFASIELESLLGLQCFLGQGVLLQVDVPQLAVVIHKNGDTAIAPGGKDALELGHKSNSLGLDLIN